MCETLPKELTQYECCGSLSAKVATDRGVMRLTEDGGSQGGGETKFASSTLANESILL